MALKSFGGPSSEAQQNKISNHIQEPGIYRDHQQNRLAKNVYLLTGLDVLTEVWYEVWGTDDT